MAQARTNGQAKTPSVSDLTKQIETLRAELETLATDAADVGQSKIAAAKQSATAMAEDAAAYAQLQAEDIANRSAKAAHDAQMRTVEFMKTQPATAIGIAAGVGFLVGFLSKRR